MEHVFELEGFTQEMDGCTGGSCGDNCRGYCLDGCHDRCRSNCVGCCDRRCVAASK